MGKENQMHKRNLYTVSGLLLLIIALLAFLGAVNAGMAAPNGQPTPFPSNPPAVPVKESTEVLPNGQVARIPASKSDTDTSGSMPISGSSAIRPRFSGIDAMTPAFTEQDVLEYARQHPRGFGKVGMQQGPPVVERVQFLTLGALRSQATGLENLNVGDDVLVCYVQYSGDFVVSAPAGLQPRYYKSAIQIFNAHTGNLLMTGARNPIQK
jgi:hypothetical protein